MQQERMQQDRNAQPDRTVQMEAMRREREREEAIRRREDVQRDEMGRRATGGGGGGTYTPPQGQYGGYGGERGRYEGR